MSDLSAGAGAHLDLGPVSLSALVDLQTSVNTLAKAFSDWKQQEADYQYGAVDITLTGAGSTNAAGDDLVFSVEGPPEGYMWEIRSLSVGDNIPGTACTGTAYFFKGASRPIGSPVATGGSQLTTINWVDWTGANGGTMPAVAFYSARQIVLHAPDRLWVCIVGGNASNQFVVNGSAIETPDRRRRQMTAE